MGSLNFEVILIDPCLDIAVVTSTVQSNPPEYFYEEPTNPSLQWSVSPPYSTDYTCPIVYSCMVTMSPTGVDICSIIAGVSSAQFDPSGTYVFTSYDMVTYPPGDYTFEITGTVGTKSATSTFVMTLVDPCLTTALSIIDPDPFTDQTYILRDPQIDLLWDINNLITKETLVDCGPLSVEFYNDDAGQTSLDPDILLDDRAAFNLVSLSTDDVLKKGSYPLKYRVYHTIYASN